MMRTHYNNLKVSDNASSDEIRQAYKRLCQQYHPDKNQNSPESLRAFRLIHQAYEVLKNPSTRRKHDTWILQKIQNRKRIRKEHHQIPLSTQQQWQMSYRKMVYRKMVYRKILEAKRNRIEHKEQLAIKRKNLKLSIIRCAYSLSLIIASGALAHDSDNNFRYEESTNAIEITNYKVQIMTQPADITKNLRRTQVEHQIPEPSNIHTEDWAQENIF